MDLNHEPESLGGFLRAEREKRNVSIEQVAYATRIGIKMLHALEVDDHNQLPSPTFVRGYLQAYGKFLKIDSYELLGKYDSLLSQSPNKREVQIRSHYLYVKERYQERKKLFLIIALCALTLVLAGVYGVLKSKRDARKQLAQQLKAEQSQTHTPTAGAIPTASNSGVGASIVSPLNATTPSMMKAKADGSKPATLPIKPTSEQPALKKDALKKPEPAIAAATFVAPTVAPSVPATAPLIAPKKEGDTPKEETAKPMVSEKKKYNLLVRAEKDVWLKFQLDNGVIKELTLREGKTLMMRADSVIKIFSGNLNGLKAALNGKEVPSLSSNNRALSVIIPETETAKYPLPLFPASTNPVAPSSPQKTTPPLGSSSDTLPANAAEYQKTTPVE